jgi:hypothetical protein
VCSADGCPRLRNEAYRADPIDEQLEDQACYVHSHDRWVRFSPDSGAWQLTRSYLWYGSDFRQVAGSVPNFAGRYSPETKRPQDAGTAPKIVWLTYDWALNSKANKR